MKPNEQIKFFRKLKGWSQEELANKLDMSLNGYGGIERGEAELTHTRLEQIAEVFGVNLIELLKLNEKWILNLACEVSKSTWNQGIESPTDYQQIKFDLEKAQLLNDEKDKEIALLKRIIELMEAKTDVANQE